MVVFEVTGILKGQHGIFPANNFLKWGEGAWLGRAKKTVDFAMRDLNTVGALRTYSVLAHRYVCSLAKVVPHAKLRSFAYT